MINKELLYSTFTFLGLIIGAGIFAIPYVVAKAGFLTGVIDLVLLTIILIYVCLCLGEIVLRTKGKHQLTGLAEKYLGKEGKQIMFIAIIVSSYSALTAYTIGTGAALNSLFNWNQTYWSILFLIIVSTILLFKLKVFETFENIFTPIKLIIILIIIALAFSTIKTNNLTGFNLNLIYIPYGVLLFALTGFSVIPEMAREIKNKATLKKSIILGISIAAIIYLLYALVVVGNLGKNTTELSTIALGQQLGKSMLVLANLFALIAMATAFVAVGFALKENYILDNKLNKTLSWLLVIAPLFILTLIGKFSFVKVIEVGGIVGTGISLLAILVMHGRAIKEGNKKPAYKMPNYKFIKGIIILLIILGIVYEFFRVI